MVTQQQTFVHDNKSFEVRVAIFEDRYCVSVFLNDVLVSPKYSATIEVGQDFFSQHQESIVSELARIAESDIRRELYFKA